MKVDLQVGFLYTYPSIYASISLGWVNSPLGSFPRWELKLPLGVIPLLGVKTLLRGVNGISSLWSLIPGVGELIKAITKKSNLTGWFFYTPTSKHLCKHKLGVGV